MTSGNWCSRAGYTCVFTDGKEFRITYKSRPTNKDIFNYVYYRDEAGIKWTFDHKKGEMKVIKLGDGSTAYEMKIANPSYQ